MTADADQAAPGAAVRVQRRQVARVFADVTLGGRRFVVKAVETSTKRHGPHVRLEHRLDGRIVDPSAWLDAFREVDPDGYRAWIGADDEDPIPF